MVNSVLIKPAGPDCNLRCNYCFYRQKAAMFDATKGKTHRMSDKVLETLIRDCMQAGIRTFSWQGGEPTLMGLDFYRRAVELEIRYGPPGATVANALQTNGVLLDAQWARFLAEYRFLVGLSLDGPKRLHDVYRKDASGKGTFDRVMRAAKIMRDAGVEYNVLCLLNDRNVKEPEAVYDFLAQNEIYFMQFVPCVEPGTRRADRAAGQKGSGSIEPAPFSITPEQYGEFLVRVFDRWVEDFPNVSIRDFDDLLLLELGEMPGTCTTSERCGSYVVVEHNGDVFACDFFVVARWRLGNIMERPLGEIIQSAAVEEFARAKSDLGKTCKKCKFLQKCWGGCQKHRIVLDGKLTDPSYFCKSYKRLFAHAADTMPRLAEQIRERGYRR